MEIVNTFYLCAIQGNTSLLKDLHKYHSIDVDISDKEGTTPLILASANNQLEMTIELLKMGANPNKFRNSGASSLFFACQAGYTKLAEVLIQYGANVNQQNRRDRGTPLLVAAQNGHTNCVSLLLSKGASVNHQLKDGASSLFLAAQGGHVNTLETLIKHGGDVNLTKRDLTSPLYISSQMGHHRIVKKLLDCGAEVDAAREDGSTSLFKATQKGHRLVIEALLKKGASVSLLGNGETALHMAALFGRTRISHLLLVNGADPMMRNKDGMSSHDVAKEAQFSDLVTVLESFEERNSTANICKMRGEPFKLNGMISNQRKPHNHDNKNKNNLNVYQARRPHDPYTAPSSLNSPFDMMDHNRHYPSSRVKTSSNSSASSTNTSGAYSSTNSSDQTSGTVNVIPRLSAPTVLSRDIPASKLFKSFMPPSNPAQLILAIQSMAKPSIVNNDRVTVLKPPCSKLSHEIRENSVYLLPNSNTLFQTGQRTSQTDDSVCSDDRTLQKHLSNTEDDPDINEMEDADVSEIEKVGTSTVSQSCLIDLIQQKPSIEKAFLENLPEEELADMNIEKLLATRHSNPEIRDIEIYKRFTCCTKSHAVKDESTKESEGSDQPTNQKNDNSINEPPPTLISETDTSNNIYNNSNNNNPPIVVGTLPNFTRLPIKTSFSNSANNFIDIKPNFNLPHSFDTSNTPLSTSKLSTYLNSPPPYRSNIMSNINNNSTSRHRLHHHHHHHHLYNYQNHYYHYKYPFSLPKSTNNYVPPNNYPPPLPIPPQLSAYSHNTNSNLNPSNLLASSSLLSGSNTYSSSTELDKLGIDSTTVMVGRRKMSQPNIKTFLFEK